MFALYWVPLYVISMIHSIELSFLKHKLWIVMLFHSLFPKGEQNSHNETMHYSLFSADCLLCTDVHHASGKLNIQNAMY